MTTEQINKKTLMGVYEKLIKNKETKIKIIILGGDDGHYDIIAGVDVNPNDALMILEDMADHMRKTIQKMK